MKAVLISIQPRHCENIASGKKTIEVRKNRPTIDVPFKCFIYCTKDERYKIAPFRFADGWHIKQYGKGTTWANGCMANMGEQLNGKVIGEFVCDEIYEYPFDWATFTAYGKETFIIDENELKLTCLSRDEFDRYGADSDRHKTRLCGWHISDLKIYDKPKEFKRTRDHANCGCLDCGSYDGGKCLAMASDCWKRDLHHPPQSWCYVEDIRLIEQ